jgi:hypothetical protein
VIEGAFEVGNTSGLEATTTVNAIGGVNRVAPARLPRSTHQPSALSSHLSTPVHSPSNSSTKLALPH